MRFHSRLHRLDEFAESARMHANYIHPKRANFPEFDCPSRTPIVKVFEAIAFQFPLGISRRLVLRLAGMNCCLFGTNYFLLNNVCQYLVSYSFAGAEFHNFLSKSKSREPELLWSKITRFIIIRLKPLKLVAQPKIIIHGRVSSRRCE